MHKMGITFLIALQGLVLLAIDTNVIQRVRDVLQWRVVPDVVPNEYVVPSFSERYGALLVEGVCTSNQVLEALAFLSTNCCAVVECQTNHVAMDVQGCAIDDLSRFDVGREHIDALFYSVTNNACGDVYDESRALVRALGLGHDAFVSYQDILQSLPTNKSWNLSAALRLPLLSSGNGPSITNRAISFYIGAAAMKKGAPPVIDSMLSKLWPGYGVSSNRIEILGSCLQMQMHPMDPMELRGVEPLSENPSNRTSSITAALLTFPP